MAQDYAQAVKWYRLAAEQGYAEAQNNLGGMYYAGKSVPQDFSSAHMWFNVSGANGHQSASKQRDLIASKMLAADLSEAQRRARMCMESNYRECD